MNKKKTWIILLFLVITLGTNSCEKFQSSHGEEFQTPRPHPPIFKDFSLLNLPNELEFCGEKISLSNPELRERAEREFLLNIQQPGQLQLYFKRAGKYFSLFETALREENMPDDLKYLPVAESALYMARSGKDAVGLWQFMPETARSFGLQVDEFVDERRHPQKSTYAALTYLRGGYRRFHSWLMAAAGYNMGYTGLENDCSFQNTEKFDELYLNEETSRYVFRIAVIKYIFDHKEQFGFQSASYPSIQTENLVNVHDEIPNLSQWAKQHSTTYKNIKLLNPWILKRSLPKPKHSHYAIAID
ncbi:MAG TPA: lytic transglycosylase domain-containing protein [Candidatus Kapabacteria bacterium]|jgi:membrane-bound lytic murein transglycosylase D|nr:lytic transglycosylase domain-containing protein [Ignavibacteria bacterium]HRK59544.1 lytic transglycosylase domain-containing protein [Candidatus Kapabacteria bacterium]